jgi:hypothetical protein
VLKLSNATFYGNSATEGGGLYNDNSEDYGKIPALNQVTFHGNTADLGSGIYNKRGPLEILSSILYEGNDGDEIHDETGRSTIDYSIVRGGFAGNGNLDAALRRPWRSSPARRPSMQGRIRTVRHTINVT